MKFRALLTSAIVSFALQGTALASEGFFDSHGVKIHYVTEGEGEAVVLVHGWMSDVGMWGPRDASGRVKLDTKGLPGFQVIAVDCRGHGESDKPHDKEKYGTEMAADVVRLLDHLKIKRAHLVGYSMGVFIVGKVVATHPDRVLSIVYGGQSPLIVGDSNGSSEIDSFAKAVAEGKGLGPYIIEVTPAGLPKPTLEQANAIAKYMYGGKDLEAFADAGLSFPKLAVSTRDLQRCKAPTLFIYGSKDSANTIERVATLRKVLGRGDLKVIEGANHMTTLINPEFGSTVIQFILAHRATRKFPG